MLPFQRLSPLAAALFVVMGAVGCQSTTPPEVQNQATAEAPAATALPPPATPEEKEQAVLQYAQMRLMKSFDQRCHWLDGLAQLALDASLVERSAWLEWQKVDAKQAEAKAKDLIAQNASIACNSPTGQQHQSGIRYGVWQMRSSWALRAYSLLPDKEQPLWYVEKSSVARHRAALDTAIAGMKEINARSTEISLEMFRSQAGNLLATRCNAQDKQCPAVPADAGYRAYAEKVLTQAEAYASALEGAEDKVGKSMLPKAE